MSLSREDIEIAAITLCESSSPDDWGSLSERHREGYRLVVAGSWDALAKGKPKTPGLWTVFLAWMGDDDEMARFKRAMAS